MKKIVLVIILIILIGTGSIKPVCGLEENIKGMDSRVQTSIVGVRARPSGQKITVDDEYVDLRVYNIEGYNYFMLRDLAYVLNGSKSQFEVSWDQEKFEIKIIWGSPYTGFKPSKNIGDGLKEEIGYESRAKIYIDGEERSLGAYTIGGYTYFKLRDLGSEIGFGVYWDEESKTVRLYSDKNDLVMNSFKEGQDIIRENLPADISLDKAYVADYQDKMREDMLLLINKARMERGLGLLVFDHNLNKMAEYKCQDLEKTGKLSHSGSYGEFRDLLHMFGENSGGENILVGGRDVDHMFELWWNSPGHRKNMLNPNFKRIGIAFEKCTIEYGGYWATQSFGF